MVQPKESFMSKIGWPVLTALMASGICFLIWQMWDVGLKLAAFEHNFEDVNTKIELLRDENKGLKMKLNDKNRAQWSLLREISTDMRNQYVDVQYVKTIQATVVLPNLIERREAPQRQAMKQLQEKTKQLSRLEPKKLESLVEIRPILKRLEDSKVMRKEPLTEDLDHYIQQQQQIQNVPSPALKKNEK